MPDLLVLWPFLLSRSASGVLAFAWLPFLLPWDLCPSHLGPQKSESHLRAWHVLGTKRRLGLRLLSRGVSSAPGYQYALHIVDMVQLQLPSTLRVEGSG